MKRLLYSLVFIFLCLFSGLTYSQQISAEYGTKITSGTGSTGASGADVSGFSNLINSSGSGFATLSVTTIVGVSNAWISFSFPGVVAANTTVYFRTGILSATLLSGNISIQAYNNTAGSGDQVALSTASTPVQTYYTPDGGMYMAVTPTAAFQSVRFTLTSAGLLGTNNVNLYYVFYSKNASNDFNPFPNYLADCGVPNLTSTSLVGPVSITTPLDAFDNNITTTKSAFNTTGISSSAHIKQTFYFNGNSNTSDAVRIIFSKGSSIVSANLLSNVSVQGYKGTSPVGDSQLFSNLLDVDLVTLLGNNNLVTAYFAPKNGSTSVIFDRVVVDVSLGFLSVNVGANALNIFDIRRVPDVPTASNVTACTNIGTVNLAASTLQKDLGGIGSFTYSWYNAIRQGTLLSTIVGQLPYLVTGLTTIGQKDYYVDVTKSGCTVPSGRTKVTITTVNPPVAPPVALVP